MRIYIFSIIYLALNHFALGQSEVIPLYPEGIPCKSDLKIETSYDRSGRIFKKVGNPELWHYPASNPKNHAALLIIPGGGYYGLWFDKEGVDIANWVNGLGISAFVLKYRLPYWENEDCKDQVALMDALRAMRIIRKNAIDWNLNSEKIGVIGFSAGGHLASTLSTHYDKGLEKSTLSIDKFSSRPDFSALIYPVITMKKPNVNLGSRENLLGKIPDLEKLDYFSNELWVNQETPPTILIHASDDKVVVPENSLTYYKALIDHGVNAELHIWQNGGHGFAISQASGSVRNWLSVIKEWMINNDIIETVIVD